MRSSQRALKELVASSSAQSSTVSAMLDEIARLRSLLEHCHAKDCAVLRHDKRCDCGYEDSRARSVEEVARLRAELLECHRVIGMHCKEIGRLSAQVVCAGGPPPPPNDFAEGTDVGPPPRAASRLGSAATRATTERDADRPGVTTDADHARDRNDGPTSHPARGGRRARTIKAAHLPTRR